MSALDDKFCRRCMVLWVFALLAFATMVTYAWQVGKIVPLTIVMVGATGLVYLMHRQAQWM